LHALVLVGVLGCDALPGRPDPADREPVPSAVTDLAALYRGACAGCHGADGRLGAARPLHDAVYLALVPKDALREVIARGAPLTTMHAFSDDQRWSAPAPGAGPLAAAMPPWAAPLGDATRGAGVFASACASCHGADGRGTERGGDVVDATFLALASDQSLRTTVIAGRSDLGMPDWRGERGLALDAEQVADVVAWLASHRRLPLGRPQSGTGGGRPDS
jgi:cytochrome c oxidase cbb3-type subunit 3/ubiquinol-cytochrome c reductase cytochrome c subunit